MGPHHDDLEGLGPFGQPKQAPLVLRHETRLIYPVLQRLIGVNDIGASIVTALHSEFEGRARAISYSRSNDHYTGRRLSARYKRRPICEQVDFLAEAGLIHHDKAPRFRLGWQSSMEPTPELMSIVRQAIAEQGRPKLIIPRDPIMVRGADGQMIQRRETREELRMRRQVEAINEGLGSISVSDESGADHSAYGARIFNEALTRGGRLYMQGGAFQSLPKDARKRVLINGDEGVELDFKALHPSFLYADVGHPSPTDCYDIRPWDRDLVKVGLLILVNAKTLRSARLAVANHATMTPVAVPGSRVAEGLAEKLLHDIERVHAPIARFFHKDTGARLMRRDSDIAVRVMLAMQRRGEVVLPIHDSFIVRASMADQLREVMYAEAVRSGLPSPQIV